MMKDMKSDVRNGTKSDQDILKSRYISQNESQGSPMIGLSVGNFIQLISMDQQTCLVEVYHSEGHKGVFYFIEGDLYNAVYGDLEGEEAAIEMISWENARININTKTNMNGVARKIGKKLLSLLMESARRRDEAEWENRLKNLKDIVHNKEEVFGAVTTQSDERTPSSNNIVKKLGECIEVCKRNMGDALLSAIILSASDGRALDGFNLNSGTVSLIKNITATVRKVFENDFLAALGRYFILELRDNQILFSFLCDECRYQLCIVFDGSKLKLSLFLEIVAPKIVKIIMA